MRCCRFRASVHIRDCVRGGSARLGAGFGYGGCGGMGMGGGIMWDADGNFLDRDAFEANLDQWIEDGVLSADDKEAYLSQYDYCAEYGGDSVGVRGGGMGRWA